MGVEELRKRIEQADDLPREQVEIPEWGITKDDRVFVRTMEGTERDAFEGENWKIKAGTDPVFNRQNFRARLVARCLVDEHGNRIFQDAQMGTLSR